MTNNPKLAEASRLAVRAARKVLQGNESPLSPHDVAQTVIAELGEKYGWSEAWWGDNRALIWIRAYDTAVRAWRLNCRERPEGLSPRGVDGTSHHGPLPSSIDKGLEAKLLAEAIMSLPDELRGAYALCELRGLSQAEAAGRLESTFWITRGNHERACDRLRAAMRYVRPSC